MSEIKNNLFDYATSELSQDAIIRYCLEFFNCNNELKQLSIDLLNLILDNKAAINNVTKIDIRQQFKKIDVLVLMPENNIAIIIEDKVNTNEHSNQIDGYKKKINDAYNNKELDQFQSEPKIYTVYLKTGYLNDDDFRIKKNVDKMIMIEDMIQVLKNYIDKDYIIKSYYELLCKKENEYRNTTFVQEDDTVNKWEWNIACNNIAQQKFIRSIFPKEMPEYKFNIKDNKHQCRIGTSGGRPWAQYDIFETIYDDVDFCLFWRVDTDTKGSYLSLRFYCTDKEPKKQENKEMMYKDIKDKTWKIYHRIKKNYENCTFNIKKVNDNYYYNESTIIHFIINDIVHNWDNKNSDYFIKLIRELDNEVEEYLYKNYK